MNITLRNALLAAGACMLFSCGHDPQSPGIEFMPDMYRSPSYETYQADAFFADSSTALKPVAGTIPRGYNTYFPFPNTNEGYEAAGALLKSPVERNDATLAEGKRLFEIYCRHCHGDKGDGKGTLRIKGEPFPVPSYYDKALVDLPEGKMYFSVTFGKNLMGSHASQLNPDERWLVIGYIKQMQKVFREGAVPAAADSVPATGGNN